MKPFLDRGDKGIIVLCRTSNPGAGEFQELYVDAGNQQMGMTFARFYQVVAHRVATHWNYNDNCAVVVGATAPEQIGSVRKLIGDMWMLIPGVGTQGGDVEQVVKNGLNSKGHGLIISSSSDIIFASKEKNFAEAARSKAQVLTWEINTALEKAGNFPIA